MNITDRATVDKAAVFIRYTNVQTIAVFTRYDRLNFLLITIRFGSYWNRTTTVVKRDFKIFFKKRNGNSFDVNECLLSDNSRE